MWVEAQAREIGGIKVEEDRHSVARKWEQPVGFLHCCYSSSKGPMLFKYLVEPKFLTIPKGTGLTDHQTDAELVVLTALALHNHSILIPIRTQEEESADEYPWIPIERIVNGIRLLPAGDYDWVIQRPNSRTQSGDD